MCIRDSGISWCAICDGAAYRDKDVVVIGGGNSAVEESIYLAEIVHSLTIVTMFDLTADPISCDKLRAMDNVTIYPCLLYTSVFLLGIISNYNTSFCKK